MMAILLERNKKSFCADKTQFSHKKHESLQISGLHSWFGRGNDKIRENTEGGMW